MNNAKDVSTAIQTIGQLISRRDKAISVLQETVSQLASDVVPDVATRQKSFSDSYLRYLDILQKYQNDKAVTPLDVFPGIHTSAAALDTDAYRKDAAEMRQLAETVEEQQGALVSAETLLVELAKKLLRDTKSVLDRADLVRDSLSELMHRMDSAYDVGYLSKNS